MIEIRHDEISDEAGQARWAELLAAVLGKIELPSAGAPAMVPTAGGRHA
jgi:predicted N-formylglutamate amidohydrolase